MVFQFQIAQIRRHVENTIFIFQNFDNVMHYKLEKYCMSGEWEAMHLTNPLMGEFFKNIS